MTLDVFAHRGFAGVHPENTVGAFREAADTAEAGMAVNAWTATTWRRVAALREAGVDGVIADYPGLTRW